MDIGANIGNHALYFQKKYHAEKVYCFEPVKATYDILVKNININHLKNKIIPYNVGAGEREYNACIAETIHNNRGGTSITEAAKGKLCVKTIDSYNFENISLIKVDTEGYEANVLKGMIQTIKKNRPIIMIEINEKNLSYVDGLMKELQYFVVKDQGDKIYMPIERKEI